MAATTAKPDRHLPEAQDLDGRDRAAKRGRLNQGQKHDGGGASDDTMVDDGRGDRGERRGDQEGFGGDEGWVVAEAADLRADERDRGQRPRRQHRPHRDSQTGRFAAGEDDGGRGGGDADGTAQLGDEAATAAAHVEPELDGEEWGGDRERDEPGPAGGATARPTAPTSAASSAAAISHANRVRGSVRRRRRSTRPA